MPYPIPHSLSPNLRLWWRSGGSEGESMKFYYLIIRNHDFKRSEWGNVDSAERDRDEDEGAVMKSREAIISHVRTEKRYVY